MLFDTVCAYGSGQCVVHNIGYSDNISLSTTSKDTPFGQCTNQFHLLHGYGYCLSQQPFLATPQYIRNKPSIHQKHIGVPDTSDGCEGTLYPRMEDVIVPVSQAMGRIAYLPPWLCTRNVVTFTHNQNDTYVTHFGGDTIMLRPLTRHLQIFIPFSCQVQHYTSLLLQYIRCHTLPI
jgi:hypothetical protein